MPVNNGDIIATKVCELEIAEYALKFERELEDGKYTAGNVNENQIKFLR